MKIEVQFSEESLLGGISEHEIAPYDVPASIDKYAELLAAALRAEFPTYEVEVTPGINDICRALPDDPVAEYGDIEPTEDSAREVIGRIFDDMAWGVEK